MAKLIHLKQKASPFQKKASLCDLLAKMGKALRSFGKGARFWTGIVLLLGNIPFGYLSLALGGWLALRYDNKQWGLLGTALYGVSWGMLGLSIVLLGSNTKQFISTKVKAQIKAYKRYNKYIAAKNE